MDISGILSTHSKVDFLDPATAARPTGKQTLGVDDFLKLLTVQLQSQDPLKPMEDTQFISQMASFTSLQEMRSLSKNFETFSTGQRLSSAQGYLGKVVTLTTKDGDVTGEVTAIKLVEGAPRLTIGTGSYDPADVTRITSLPASSPSQSTTH